MFFKKKDIKNVVKLLLVAYLIALIMCFMNIVPWGLWEKIPFHIGFLVLAVHKTILGNMLSPKESKE
ncbi:hypothetical protein [Prevotella intermedia]|nr:hypothetical protein [Prevotella intermedia]